MKEKKEQLLKEITLLEDFLKFLDKRKNNKELVWRKKKDDTRT
jgi:hypothetical protein